MEVTELQAVRLNRDAFHLIAEAGLLDEGDRRLELLDGDIYIMPTESPRHAFLSDALRTVLGHSYSVREGHPIHSGEDELVPDLAILNGEARQYRDRKSTRLNSSHSTLSRMPSSA